MFNNVDAKLAPHTPKYIANPGLDQQCLETFSFSVDGESEISDSMTMPHHISKLSACSTLSSVQAIPDVGLPALSPSHSTFPMTLGSPYHSHSSSASSLSITSATSEFRPRFGLSHPLDDAASDGACKLVIRNVKSGVTDKDIRDLLEGKMPRYSQYKRPKQGDDKNTWFVAFSKEDIAQVAKEVLHEKYFKGRLLEAEVSVPGDDGGRTTAVLSGGSAASTISSPPKIRGLTIC